MDDAGKSKQLKTNQEIGIGNGKRKPIPLGYFWGVFHSEEHPNRTHALVKLHCNKQGHVNAEMQRICRKFHLEKVGNSRSLVLVPLKCLVAIFKEKGAKVGRRK